MWPNFTEPLLFSFCRRNDPEFKHRDKLRKLKNRGDHYSLKKLAEWLLGKKIQGHKHSAIEDAKATMELYLLDALEWETDLHMWNDVA